MTTERMTIHKALAELKTLDDRINKAITTLDPVAANKRSNKVYKGVSITDWCEQAKSDYQKATDLICRRNAIKRAVVLSNATTKVTIGGQEYSVAEAIEMKNHGMENKQSLLGFIANKYRSAGIEIERQNGANLENKADTYIGSLYGNSDMKNLSADVQKVRSEFIESQTYVLVDPLGVEKIMEALAQEINDFMIEVDSALSVSNALTEIEISY